MGQIIKALRDRLRIYLVDRFLVPILLHELARHHEHNLGLRRHGVQHLPNFLPNIVRIDLEVNCEPTLRDAYPTYAS